MYSDWLRAGRSGDRIPVGARFSSPVQTGLVPTQPPVQWVPGLSPGVKSGRGVTLTPHPLLMPWSRKSRAILLLPLWAVWPVQSLSACTRLHFTFYFYRLYRIIFTDTGVHRGWGSHCKQQWCLLPHNCATWTLKSLRCSLSNIITWTSADAVVQMSVFWDKTSSSS